MKLAVVLTLLVLLADLSLANSPATSSTQPIVGQSLTAFRESGGLNQLMLIRVSVSEMDFDDDIKQKAAKAMDEIREKILALVAKEEAAPSDDASRKAAMQTLLAQFRPALKEAGIGDGIPAERIGQKMGLMRQEFQILQKGEDAVLKTAEKLDLSDEQQEKVRQALQDPEHDNDEWMPPNERMMADLLSRRERLRKVLNDEQKQKWDDLMREQVKQRTLQKIQGGTIH